MGFSSSNGSTHSFWAKQEDVALCRGGLLVGSHPFVEFLGKRTRLYVTGDTFATS